MEVDGKKQMEEANQLIMEIMSVFFDFSTEMKRGLVYGASSRKARKRSIQLGKLLKKYREHSVKYWRKDDGKLQESECIVLQP